MAYVGDNPAKDFQAPLRLGMRAIRYRNNDGLYLGDDMPGVTTVIDVLGVMEVIGE